MEEEGKGREGWVASGTFKCGGARRGHTWRAAATRWLPGWWVRAFPIGFVGWRAEGGQRVETNRVASDGSEGVAGSSLTLSSPVLR